MKCTIKKEKLNNEETYASDLNTKNLIMEFVPCGLRLQVLLLNG
jgi:hypothetical protein